MHVRRRQHLSAHPRAAQRRPRPPPITHRSYRLGCIRHHANQVYASATHLLHPRPPFFSKSLLSQREHVSPPTNPARQTWPHPHSPSLQVLSTKSSLAPPTQAYHLRHLSLAFARFQVSHVRYLCLQRHHVHRTPHTPSLAPTP